MFSAMDANNPPPPVAAQASPGQAANTKPEALSEAEERKLRELRETDARVRRHEEAHRAAAGSLYRGGPNYTYETGPDGKRYAVAGSVSIDTSPGRTPEETVQKAAQIRRAALAPIDPSSTDRAIASKATRLEDAARRALMKQSMAGREAAPAPSGDTEEADPQNPRAKVQPKRTLSPGDLGGEVWSSVSALGDSEQLKQERRPDAVPTPAPNLDVLA